MRVDALPDPGATLPYNPLQHGDADHPHAHAELDPADQAAVDGFFCKLQPEDVFLAAARVGSIVANNTYPAEFIRDNLAIQTNIIHAAWKNQVKRLMFLGSSCIYPKLAPQPMKEDCLLTGPPRTDQPVRTGRQLPPGKQP